LTQGTDPDGGKNGDFKPTYDPARVGCHIGAGLIAADLDELTGALIEARKDDGSFDIHKWGSEGMQHLTPLWLLKYLPNMLACHVTIIHDNQGPSNTITCGEASAMLSIGESLRVIQRDKADLCFCGGAESKMNPMVYYRQQLTGRLTTAGNDDPQHAVRPYDQNAAGTVAGDGGGIVMLEALETYQERGGENAYAQVVGFGASQSVNREAKNMEPDPQGKAVVSSVNAALREAGIGADEIDMVVGFGCGVVSWDQAETNGLKAVLGDRLKEVPVLSLRAMVGNCGAGGGGLDIAIAAKALREQKVPAVINRDTPIDGMSGSAASKDAELQYALVFNMGMGGQNTACFDQCTGQFIKISRDQPRTDVAAHARRVIGRLEVAVLPAIRVGPLGQQLRITGSIIRRDDRQLDIPGHHFRGLAVALRHELVDLKRLYLCAHLTTKAAWVERLDTPDRGAAGTHALPRRLNTKPKAADRPNTAYHYASCHG